MSERVMIYKRFERFWHWTQAALIIMLAVTGFEVHGSFRLLGFEAAVSLHELLAWLLITLIVFAVFWHFTTGEWRQYIPRRGHLGAMLRYYLKGIFRGEAHPVKKTELSKLNPLQRLTYLGLKLAVIPLQDFLSLGSEARMNTPGTTDNNWLWAFTWEQLDIPAVSRSIRTRLEKSNRMLT